MTTGPEHYTAAEELLETVINGDAGDTMMKISELITMAQVHATLALAAATALNDAESGMSSSDYNSWYAVTSVAGADQVR